MFSDHVTMHVLHIVLVNPKRYFALFHRRESAYFLQIS